MVQKRINDYRGPRSAENLNSHLVGVLPPGVYEGFHVGPNGSISSGVLLTPEGIRIEETEGVAVALPPADPDLPRVDLVVCIHEYQKTVPAPPATYEVVTGTPGMELQPRDLPAHATLLATCLMEAGATAWTHISQVGPPMRIYNAVEHADHSWHIVRGELGAMVQRWLPNAGALVVHIVAANTLEDGELIDWGQPVLRIDAAGIQQVIALDEAKLDKTGGTISGDLVLQGKVTFSAAHAADVAFDDWVEFTRWIQPCEANSKDWDNLGFAWKSVSDPLGTTLYVPIHGIVGTELVSVFVGLYNVGALSLNVTLGFSTSDLADFIGASVDFGEVTIGIDGSESLVHELLLVDPVAPHEEMPFAFDQSRPLWLRVKTGGAGVMFTGARCRMRRKGILA